jgi:hypothetical protein
MLVVMAGLLRRNTESVKHYIIGTREIVPKRYVSEGGLT